MPGLIIKRGKDAMKSVGKDAINVYLRNCGAEPRS
jgi:hypothetical protein